MIYITKRKKYQIILDDDDDIRELVESATFLTVNKGGYPVWTKYLYKKDGRSFTETHWLSRMIMKAPDNMQVDHINGNPLDNRRENLRLVSNTQNSWNAVKKSNKKATKYKGVYVRKEYTPHKYSAQIRVGSGKRFSLGIYDTEEEAHEAYKHASLEHHGEFSIYADGSRYDT